jgi:hypothetical protein
VVPAFLSCGNEHFSLFTRLPLPSENTDSIPPLDGKRTTKPDLPAGAPNSRPADCCELRRRDPPLQESFDAGPRSTGCLFSRLRQPLPDSTWPHGRPLMLPISFSALVCSQLVLPLGSGKLAPFSPLEQAAQVDVVGARRCPFPSPAQAAAERCRPYLLCSPGISLLCSALQAAEEALSTLCGRNCTAFCPAERLEIVLFWKVKKLVW